MVAALEALVQSESPSADIGATAQCATTLAAIGTALLGAPPERVEVDGRTHLRWQFGARTRVAIVGHFDTVWPLGTAARWPFAVQDGRATGPGTFDMKAGVIQSLYGLALLDDLDGVTVLMTSDEELGSPTSRHLIEDLARGARAALWPSRPAGTGRSIRGGRGCRCTRYAATAWRLMPATPRAARTPPSRWPGRSSKLSNWATRRSERP